MPTDSHFHYDSLRLFQFHPSTLFAITTTLFFKVFLEILSLLASFVQICPFKPLSTKLVCKMIPRHLQLDNTILLRMLQLFFPTHRL